MKRKIFNNGDSIVMLSPKKITKRSFWSRFPSNNLAAMQAILRSGAPALLAGRLSVLQLLVSDSPFVDLNLDQTINGINSLATVDFPETVVIDGVTLPLRLTVEESELILAAPTDIERYTE